VLFWVDIKGGKRNKGGKCEKNRKKVCGTGDTGGEKN
jgi:hypothetical protein